ncbi:MAG: hypothetical protein HFH36_14625 [Lachnospiraceae bacterium]|nr:hypothetical protein [Lachnospiraceae bacterium]
MDFDYAAEKAKLKKKLMIFLGVTIVFTVLLLVATGEGFFYCLLAGVMFGLFFYIPGRVKSYLGLSWLGTIVIVFVYYAIFIFLGGKFGSWILIFAILLPVADIGYSIFRIASTKKNQ